MARTPEPWEAEERAKAAEHTRQLRARDAAQAALERQLAGDPQARKDLEEGYDPVRRER